MTKIYLVRHAEAEGNLYRIAHGHYNGLITDWRGPKQIRALAQRFEGIRVDAVYSSDLYRTQTTAQAVYVPKHLPLHTSPAFREVHMGAAILPLSRRTFCTCAIRTAPLTRSSPRT